MIGVHETVVAISTLKPGISWRLPVLHALEEAFVRFIQAKEDILQDVRGDLLILWPERFLDLDQIALLLIHTDGVLLRELFARRFIVVVGMTLDTRLIGVAALL